MTDPEVADRTYSMEETPSDRERLAEVIWTASRADESTISATGANVVADAVLDFDWLARVKREAAVEALRAAHDEIHALDPPEYHDAPQYREGLIDGHGAAAVCLVLADRIEEARDADHA